MIIIVASHMGVCVFTVLIGTSHNLFWKPPQHYMCHSESGATLIAFLSTFRYFPKLHPYRIIADIGPCQYPNLSFISDTTSVLPPKLTGRGGSFPLMLQCHPPWTGFFMKHCKGWNIHSLHVLLSVVPDKGWDSLVPRPLVYVEGGSGEYSTKFLNTAEFRQ